MSYFSAPTYFPSVIVKVSTIFKVKDWLYNKNLPVPCESDICVYLDDEATNEWDISPKGLGKTTIQSTIDNMSFKTYQE